MRKFAIIVVIGIAIAVILMLIGCTAHVTARPTRTWPPHRPHYEERHRDCDRDRDGNCHHHHKKGKGHYKHKGKGHGHHGD